MSGPSGCQKIEKIFVEDRPARNLGRRIRSEVAGSGIAPRQIEELSEAWSGRGGKAGSYMVIEQLHPKATTKQ